MPLVAAIQEAEAGGSLEPGRWRLQLPEIVSLHPSLGDKVRLCLKNKTSPAWWLTPIIPEFEHFARLRQADHLRSGVQDQLGYHDKTPFLLKIQKKLVRRGGTHL